MLSVKALKRRARRETLSFAPVPYPNLVSEVRETSLSRFLLTAGCSFVSS